MVSPSILTGGRAALRPVNQLRRRRIPRAIERSRGDLEKNPIKTFLKRQQSYDSIFPQMKFDELDPAVGHLGGAIHLAAQSSDF